MDTAPTLVAADLPGSAAAAPGAIRQLPFAPLLELSLGRVGGAMARPLLRDGQAVRRGELLAIDEEAGALPVHAPASGRLLRRIERPDGCGGIDARLLLAPWPGDTQEYAMPTRHAAALADREALLLALQAAGIAVEVEPERSLPLVQRLREAGRGGLLLVNAIDGEPPFRLNGVLLRRQAEAIRLGLRALARVLAPAAVVLAVEGADAGPASRLLEHDCGQPQPVLRPLTPRYPQADPRLLPGLLAEAGEASAARYRGDQACVLPLRALAEAGELLASGEAATSRLIELAGSGLREPAVFRVPLGTPLAYVLGEAGLAAQSICVLQGGALRGRALGGLELPIDRGHTGFLVLAAAADQEQEWPCSRCGDCLQACPVGLNPAELGLLARNGEHHAMRALQGLEACIECGACGWVCPSRIPLLQRFRAAKAQLRRLDRLEPA